MFVYLNGRFVPEEKAVVSIHDRGFLYGDGLSETIRNYAGEPFLWPEHMDRFARGAVALGIVPPLSSGEMRRVLQELIARNQMPHAIARVTLSRGVGRRGYSPAGADHPTLAVALFPLPANLPKSYKIVTSRYRLLSDDPLAAFKHANKLAQIMARAEADAAGADEAVLLNDKGRVAEGTSTNLFWLRQRTVCTAPLGAGILAGVTRAHVLALALEHDFSVREESLPPENLKSADGLFVTSSGIEIMEVSHWDGRRVSRSPITRKLKALYRDGLKPLG
jgi:branched-chain amino acid aminotransferase